MSGIKVSIHHNKDKHELDFESPDLTIGELREAIERQLSVAQDVQQLICAGRKWVGVAFGNDVKVLDAAGPRGTKDVMGVKVVTLMLMAPAGVDGSEDVNKCEGQVNEASQRLSAIAADAQPDDARKELRVISDLLCRASEGLDCAKLVGAQKDRRRALLKRIEEVDQEVENTKK
eukprot:CAMPEP_0203970084 /NCGR_PEP_ID=MMETSP0359-20131031/97785_1 /ASSEMBLY_ACC=CAM_ASM_000338 /TAXON_ID=268821 /ORGANISM="Scrippsiella Hangoei, Strain SHTV-5" /LENGTH=174 /DNA_ID=CAMNT_0050908033 /DNA_START=73 /DNA_END=594 /DNA_ORIENTATION=+